MSALNVRPEGWRDHSSLWVIYCLPEVLILTTGRLNGKDHTHGAYWQAGQWDWEDPCQVRKPRSPKCMSKPPAEAAAASPPAGGQPSARNLIASAKGRWES